MATTTTAPQPIDFERRRGIELFKFTREGEDIEGQILAAREKELPDEKNTDVKKKTLCFLLEIMDGTFSKRTGRLLEFPQAADMKTKLLSGDVGKYVRIRYTGDQKMSGERAPMKKFDVDVSTKTYDLPGAITDEDIPF